MDISYDEEGRDVLITTEPASSSYTFSPYTGFYLYLYTNSIFDYEERTYSFKVYISLNPDGSCEVKDNLNMNAMAMVFTKAEVYRSVDGNVIINGNPNNVNSGYTFTNNDEQQSIYDSYVSNIPKPGDETYGSEGNLYRYNNYSSKTGLALYSVNGGDVICASRSYKHNNDKVTEIGDGGPLCESTVSGIYHIQNSAIKSIVLSKYTEKINDSAFTMAKNLKSLECPSTLRVIEREAFYCASLINGINLPDGFEEIGDYAFMGSELKVLFIPKSVHTIGRYPFEGCENLVIYCEASSKPDGWSVTWDVQDDNYPYPRHTVIWGASRSDAR